MLVVDHRCFKAGALADRCEAAYRLLAKLTFLWYTTERCAPKFPLNLRCIRAQSFTSKDLSAYSLLWKSRSP